MKIKCTIRTGPDEIDSVEVINKQLAKEFIEQCYEETHKRIAVMSDIQRGHVVKLRHSHTVIFMELIDNDEINRNATGAPHSSEPNRVFQETRGASK